MRKILFALTALFLAGCQVAVSPATREPVSATSTPTFLPVQPTLTPSPTAYPPTPTATPIEPPPLGFSGTYLLAKDGLVKEYSESGQMLRTVFTHPDPAACDGLLRMYRSPYSDRLVLEYCEGTNTKLLLINLTSGEEKLLTQHQRVSEGMHPVDWSADGRMVAFSNGGSVYLADKDGAQILSVPSPCGHGQAPRFFPNANKILFFDGYKSMCVYDLETEGSREYGPNLSTYYLTSYSNVSAKGEVILSKDADGLYTMQSMLELESGNLIPVWFAKPNWMDSVRITHNLHEPGISPDGTHFFTLRYGETTVNGQEIHYPERGNGYIFLAPLRYPSTRVLVGTAVANRARPQVNYWSADGGWFLFEGWPLDSKGEYGEYGFWAVRPDGTDRLALGSWGEALIYGAWD